jgi:hypothetical protein
MIAGIHTTERDEVMDFVHDQLANGNGTRILTIVDLFTMSVPVLDPSSDGTSRMMREYQVRICEKPGLKISGPTWSPNPW